MRFLRKNTAVIVTVGPFYDKTDGVTIETALTITNERITLTADTDDGSAPTNILDNIAGATAATANDLNYITGNDAGMMQMELAAADVNRLGRMFLSITDAANHVPVFHEFMVVNAALYDAFFATTGGAIPNVAADAAGGLPISDAGGLDLDAKLANTNEVTAARMGALTDWINGGRLDLILDTLALEATLTAMKGATFAGATDSLEAIRDRGDAAWVTAAGFATAAALATAQTDISAILVDTGTTLDGRIPAALVGGRMDSNMGAISTSSAAADALEESTEAIGYGTVDGTGATTTVFLTSALTPDSSVNDQFNGRVLIFKSDTTTAALRGQATTISDYVHTSAEIGTFTVVALTTAPVTGDTFVIL